MVTSVKTFMGSLVQHQILTWEQLGQARAQQERDQCSLARALWSLQVISPQTLITQISKATGIPTYQHWRQQYPHQFDSSLIRRVNSQGLHPIPFLPCGWSEEGDLVVAVENLHHPRQQERMAAIWPGVRITQVLITEHEILRLLVEEKLLAEVMRSQSLKLEHWHQARDISASSGSSLEQVLTRLGYLDPRDYLNLLSNLLDLPTYSHLMNTEPVPVEPGVGKQFDPPMLMDKLFFPLSQPDPAVVKVMVNDPLDPQVDELIYQRWPGIRIEKILGTERDITTLIDQTFSPRLSRQAIYHLLAKAPSESASRVFTLPQLGILFALLVTFVAGLVSQPILTLTVGVFLINIFYLSSIIYKLILTLVGTSDHLSRITDEEVAAVDNRSLPMYTILVPVYNEPDVIPILINSLRNLDYPQEKLDILILLEESDRVTIEATKAANPPKYIRLLYIPTSQPKTKPKACNYGLSFARGDYLTIYDAEDIPDPDQLKKAVIAFRKGAKSLICVQAALNYFNRNENFLTRMFTLEYSYWFDYLLPGLEALKVPIPLGGTSNHFRTDRLRILGGWDPFNVTEDADLGIRASQRGYTVGVINSTTYEEGNVELKNWIRQRSRWIKGYMQTWLVHNRNPIKSLSKLGLKSWLSYQFFIGGSIFTFLSTPLMWVMFLGWFITRASWLESLFPDWVLYMGLFNLLIGNALGIYLNLVAVFQRRYFDLLLYSLLNPVYWLLHSYASYMALWQLFTKPFYWEKTEHGLSKFTKSIVKAAAANNAQAAEAVQSTAPAAQTNLGSGSITLAAQDRPSLIPPSQRGEQKLEPS